jgi:hypothetical protein
LIKQEIVPKCGSYEVRQYGRRSLYFYWDDMPGRRLDPNMMTGEQAFEKAKALHGARGIRKAALKCLYLGHAPQTNRIPARIRPRFEPSAGQRDTRLGQRMPIDEAT